ETGDFQGVACVGAVIRGETSHYDYVCTEAARGIQDVQLTTGVPCGFGVLTVENYEQALARLGGKRHQGADAARAVLALAGQVEQAIRPTDRYMPRSRLVSVEQTTKMGGGRVWPQERLREVVAVAKRHDLRTHRDGARLMNAVVASGASAAQHAEGFDTVWV